MTDLENPISPDTCSICLSENIENPIITDCSHIYCKKCLEEWLDTGTNICPMCRKNINTYKIKNKNDNYKIVLIGLGSNNSNIAQTSSIIETHHRIYRKISLYKFYLYSSFIILLYMNYLYGKQLILNNLLANQYQDCMTNITDITNNLEYQTINEDEDDYVNVIMMMPNQEFKRCNIPEKYYMYC